MVELLERCPHCFGTRKLLCRRCYGEGKAKFNAFDSMTCPLCKGEGNMECTECPPEPSCTGK